VEIDEDEILLNDDYKSFINPTKNSYNNNDTSKFESFYTTCDNRDESEAVKELNDIIVKKEFEIENIRLIANKLENDNKELTKNLSETKEKFKKTKIVFEKVESEKTS